MSSARAVAARATVVLPRRCGRDDEQRSRKGREVPLSRPRAEDDAQAYRNFATQKFELFNHDENTVSKLTQRSRSGSAAARPARDSSSFIDTHARSRPDDSVVPLALRRRGLVDAGCRVFANELHVRGFGEEVVARGACRRAQSGAERSSISRWRKTGYYSVVVAD